jgi:hypothetical protein
MVSIYLTPAGHGDKKSAGKQRDGGWTGKREGQRSKRKKDATHGSCRKERS